MGLTMRLYNSLTKQKAEFVPLEPGTVGVYVCGPTVYDDCHVGHARCYVAFDVLIRHLRQKGYNVNYVRNITDIDDKIITRAKELNEDAIALSARYTIEFERDMASLGNTVPQSSPKVSTHMPEIIEMIGQLINSGVAYQSNNDVYFAVDKHPTYGRLSGRKLSDMQAGARVATRDAKRSPFDFALWKGTEKPNETKGPTWPSPWGDGRPGWHIECSAMSGKYLGQRFDIHAGGMDLLFPHHENEMAQSTACYGQGSFAQIWMHNGFITVKQQAGSEAEKMSKSLGNFFTIKDLCHRYHPEALRLFLLQTHYRSPIQLVTALDAKGSNDKDEIAFPQVANAEQRLSDIYRLLLKAGISGKRQDLGNSEISDVAQIDIDDGGASCRDFPAAFEQALDDDINTAAAIASFSDAITELNQLCALCHTAQPNLISKSDKKQRTKWIAHQLRLLGGRLGLLQADPTTFLLAVRDRMAKNALIDIDHVNDLLMQRESARAAKDYATADKIRDQLHADNIMLMDGPNGTDWIFGT